MTLSFSNIPLMVMIFEVYCIQSVRLTGQVLDSRAFRLREPRTNVTCRKTDRYAVRAHIQQRIVISPVNQKIYNKSVNSYNKIYKFKSHNTRLYELITSVNERNWKQVIRLLEIGAQSNLVIIFIITYVYVFNHTTIRLIRLFVCNLL